MSKHKHHIIPRYRCKELGIDPDFDENIVEVDRLDHARIHWGYKCDDLEPLFEYITPAQWIIDLIPRGDNRDVGAAVLTAKGELDGIDMSGENNPNWGGLSEETKKKLSKNLKQFYIDNPDKKPVGEKNGMYGKTHAELGTKFSDRHGENNSFYGKTHSEEHKQKYMYGEKNPMYGKPSPFTGRNHTEENKNRASEKRKSQWSDPNSIYNTPEFRKKMSEAQSGSNNGMYGRKHSDETKRKQRDAALKREAKKKAETQGEGTLKAFLK